MSIEFKIALLCGLVGFTISFLGMCTTSYPKVQRFLLQTMAFWIVGAILGAAYFIIWVL